MKVWPFKWKLLSPTFLWYCSLCYSRWLQLLSLWMKSKCDNSWHFNWVVLSSTFQDGTIFLTLWLKSWSVYDHLNETTKQYFPVMLLAIILLFCCTRRFLLESVKIHCYVDLHLKEIHTVSSWSSHPCQHSDTRRSKQLYENKASNNL